MAELSNPQLVDFANAQARVVSDKLAALNTAAATLIATYNARDLGTVINDGGAGNLIADGSETDGRTRVTGGDVFNLVTLLADLDGFMTQGRKDVIAKWRVNG